MRPARIFDVALVFAARGLLALLPPLEARAALFEVGRHFPVIESRDDALRLARSIRRHGTCLSRALVVAARTPAADLVIAVEPRSVGPLFAHAWIEMDGAPLDPADVAGTVIARIPGRHAPAVRKA